MTPQDRETGNPHLSREDRVALEIAKAAIAAIRKIWSILTAPEPVDDPEVRFVDGQDD